MYPFVSTQHSRLHPAASGVKQKLACQATGNLECAERIACGFVTAQVLSSYDLSHKEMKHRYETKEDDFLQPLFRVFKHMSRYLYYHFIRIKKWKLGN